MVHNSLPGFSLAIHTAERDFLIFSFSKQNFLSVPDIKIVYKSAAVC